MALFQPEEYPYALLRFLEFKWHIHKPHYADWQEGTYRAWKHLNDAQCALNSARRHIPEIAEYLVICKWNEEGGTIEWDDSDRVVTP